MRLSRAIDAGESSCIVLCFFLYHWFIYVISLQASRDRAITEARNPYLGGFSLSAATGGANEPRFVCGRVTSVRSERRQRRDIILEAELDITEQVRHTRMLRDTEDFNRGISALVNSTQ